MERSQRVLSSTRKTNNSELASVTKLSPLKQVTGSTADLCGPRPSKHLGRTVTAQLREALRTENRLLRNEVRRLTQALQDSQRLSLHDVLTGLPTRALLCDHFNQAIAIATRRHQEVVLLFLDLDGFKHINDTLGHTVGDAILQQVALRLTNCIRRSDTACRFGGDEFVVLLPEYKGKQAVAAIAQKIRAQIAAPYVIDRVAIEMTTSLGMATYPTDKGDLTGLIQACDDAMYQDKARNPKPPSIFGVNPADEIASCEPACSY